ncbi:MAG: hypothetical protein K9M44_00240 [Candidatus Pacebacteria bacterium]|nr:hypothetical protein [Candidatus Paceibacterota bacterium]
MILALNNEIQKAINKFLYMAVVMTQYCEEWIVDKIDNQVTTNVEHIAWGSGSGSLSKNNTTLFNEESEARIEASRSQASADVIEWIGTLTAESAKTITEAGLFNNITAGSLLMHGDFSGITLETGDKIEFTFQLEIQ